MLKYEARPKANGDYEVWRRIEGSVAPEQLVATFHNYEPDPLLRPQSESANVIARINAELFADEQNKRGQALKDVVVRMHTEF